MAYVLVAVGALMFCLGLYAAVTGSQIVQVEAGWTSVIAGSMLIVGGVLTMALGLVLRALIQLKASLQGHDLSPVVAPVVDSPAAPPVPVFGVEPAMAPDPAMSHTPTSQPAPPEEPALAEALTGAADPPTALRPPPLPGFFRKKPAPIPPVVDIAPPVRLQDTGEPPPPFVPAEPEPAAAFEGAPLHPDLDQTHDAPEPAHPDPIETTHPEDDYKIETPSTPEHDLPSDPPSPAPAQHAAEPEVDWLDRALAEIDESVPVQARRHDAVAAAHPHEIAPDEGAPQEMEPAPVEPEPDMAHAAPPVPPHADSGPPPAPARALPPAPTLPPPPTSAVIGRYEADGTSYVMYADGSIEAHSDAGTYRFASMTELKAFIEA